MKFHLVSLLQVVRKSLEASVSLYQTLLDAGDESSIYRGIWEDNCREPLQNIPRQTS